MLLKVRCEFMVLEVRIMVRESCDCKMLSTEKKMHNLKVENYALFGGHTEDLNPGDSLSDSSEGLFQRGKSRARTYRCFCKKAQVLKHQKIPVN